MMKQSTGNRIGSGSGFELGDGVSPKDLIDTNQYPQVQYPSCLST